MFFFVPLLGFPLFKKKHEKTTLAFYHYEAQIMGRWHFPARLLLLIPYGFLPWGADAPSLGVWVESFLWSFQTWRIWSISKHHGKLFSRVFDLIFAPRQRLPDLDVVSLISMNFHTNTCTTCKDCRTYCLHEQRHTNMQSYLVYICTRVGSRERNLTSLFRYQDGHWPSHAGARCDGGQSFDWRDDLPAAHDTGLTEVPVWVTGMWCCVFPHILGGNVLGISKIDLLVDQAKGAPFSKVFWYRIGTLGVSLGYTYGRYTSCKIEIIMYAFLSYLSENNSDMARLRPYPRPMSGSWRSITASLTKNSTGDIFPLS